MSLVEIAQRNDEVIQMYKAHAKALLDEMNQYPETFEKRLYFPTGFEDKVIFYEEKTFLFEEKTGQVLSPMSPIEFGVQSLQEGKNKYVRLLLQADLNGEMTFRMEIPCESAVGRFFKERDWMFRQQFVSELVKVLQLMDKDNILRSQGSISFWSVDKILEGKSYARRVVNLSDKHIIFDSDSPRLAVCSYKDFRMSVNDVKAGLTNKREIELKDGDKAMLTLTSDGLRVFYVLKNYGKPRKETKLSVKREVAVSDFLGKISWFSILPREGETELYCGLTQELGKTIKTDDVLAFLNKRFARVQLYSSSISQINEQEPANCILVSGPKDKQT